MNYDNEELFLLLNIKNIEDDKIKFISKISRFSNC